MLGQSPEWLRSFGVAWPGGVQRRGCLLGALVAPGFVRSGLGDN